MTIILIILAILFVLILVVFAYYGGFKKITIKEVEQGGEIMAYQEVVGDYSQTGKVSNEVYYTLLNDLKIETYKGVGVYYDNPKLVEKSKLCSEVGCIIETKDIERQAEIEAKFKIKTLPVGKYLVIEFPFKGTMSIMIGLMRAYPAFSKYLATNNITCETPNVELYDVPNKKIIYRKQIL